MDRNTSDGPSRVPSPRLSFGSALCARCTRAGTPVPADAARRFRGARSRHRGSVARLLGSGFGEVYAADDLAQKVRVASTVLHADLTADPLVRERFDKESRGTMAMQCAHVVKTPDAGVDGETRRPWIA